MKFFSHLGLAALFVFNTVGLGLTKVQLGLSQEERKKKNIWLLGLLGPLVCQLTFHWSSSEKPGCRNCSCLGRGRSPPGSPGPPGHRPAPSRRVSGPHHSSPWATCRDGPRNESSQYCHVEYPTVPLQSLQLSNKRSLVIKCPFIVGNGTVV